MTSTISDPRAFPCRETYFASANAELAERYSVTIAALSAELYIEAGRRAGYTPREIVDWLGEVDGL